MTHLIGYVATLYILALMDFACCGLRTASGRSALLNKYAFFKNAMIGSLLLGHVFLIIPIGALVFLIELSQQNSHLIFDLERAMQGMLVVYIPYTMLFLFALLVRSLPFVDCKSLTSILILGPITFIRPLVAIIGIAVAMIFSPHTEVIALGAVAVFFMLSFELFLERLHERNFRKRINSSQVQALPLQ